jgi:ABC-type transport system involved in multi-copper enzyme maturation permease subunit
MVAVLLKKLFSSVDGSYLAGPILDKELRVLSRRKRYYVLRFVYLAVLIVFTAVVFNTVTSSDSVIYTSSRASEAGMAITLFMISFQFFLSQVLSVIFLSTAICEEIHKKTLGILMTTPITSLQIVLGKLFSRLLLLFLLLALALPLLAVIRIFGGIPWNILITSFFIIFTSALFAGSVSLFFSIFCRSAIQSLGRSILFFILLYSLPQIVILIYLTVGINLSYSFININFINPFVALSANLASLAGARTILSGSWLVCCLFMTTGTVFFIFLSTVFVRRAARAQITGQSLFLTSRKERKQAEQAEQAQVGVKAVSKIIPVKGPPVLWKDLRLRALDYRKLRNIIGSILFVIALLLTYGLCFYYNALEENSAHIAFLCVYLIGGLFSSAAAAASSITGEKEKQTWELLMSTSISDRRIVLEKIAASALRGLPYMVLACAHITVFILIGKIHYVAFLPLSLIFLSGFFLASAGGVMISSLCKRSGWALALTFFIFLCLFNCLTPFIPSLLLFVNPLFLAGGILYYTAGTAAASKSFTTIFSEGFSLGTYGWLPNFCMAVLYLAGVLAVYWAVLYACFSLAKTHVRFRIYT